ncbi:MAG: selenium cofactor biosynthesis protein YqeC [Desulfuromonadales bacterium]
MQSIEKILSLEAQGVLSLIGGGGKTSIMFHLARLLAESGQKVLTTTTTKILVPTPEQSETVLVDSDPHMVMRLASACRKCSNHVTAAMAHLAVGGKLQGFKPGDIDMFQESGLFDWILVEADGAAGRSLKAPAEHEPVIPSCTTVLIAVAGLDILGKPLSDTFVFRSERAGKLLGLSEGETVTESALARFFARPIGPFKGAPPASRRFIFLNKADDSERAAAAARIAGLLRTTSSAEAGTLVAGQALERLAIHSVHALAKKK